MIQGGDPTGTGRGGASIIFKYSDFRILWSKAGTRLVQGGAELVFMENVLTMKYILISNIQELEFLGRNFKF